MDEVFTIIGRMYVDIIQSQKAIGELQKQLEEKNKEIVGLQNSIIAKQTEQCETSRIRKISKQNLIGETAHTSRRLDL